MRRTRSSPWVRNLVRENKLTPHDLIWPIFVHEGNEVEAVASMPGVDRLPLAKVGETAKHAQKLGIPAIALFPKIDPAKKELEGNEATNSDNLVCRAIQELKSAAPEVGVMADVALDPFTTTGQDGIVIDGKIDNDRTLDQLILQSLTQIGAGCDILAPSDMMDGRIGRIRAALETGGHVDALIMSYAAKYASSFYGPFRDAVGSSGTLKGDKKTYQMDPANGGEAMREVALDIEEGADMVMVKPGLPYLDIVRSVKDRFQMPTFAYQVSGEYAMIQAAAQNGWIDGDAVMLESLLCFKRAGCDGVLSYFAPKAAEILG
jgi:porphobilinogen synthase